MFAYLTSVAKEIVCKMRSVLQWQPFKVPWFENIGVLVLLSMDEISFTISEDGSLSWVTNIYCNSRYCGKKS